MVDPHSIEAALVAIDGFLTYVAHHGYSAFKVETFGQAVDLYYEANPFITGLFLCLLLIVYCFVGSVLTGDNSFVDRQWSIVPAVYAIHFAVHSRFAPRPTLMACLAVLWAIRLTYNFARRGGYSGMEDYRWVLVKNMMHPALFVVFNLTFMAIFQHMLLYAIAWPSYVAELTAPPPKSIPSFPSSEYFSFALQELNAVDAVCAAAFLALLIFETIADQQQYEFQEEKHRQIREGTLNDEYYARGFCTSGLFRYSRHPNYFAEQSIWVVYACFSIANSTSWYNWSFIGSAVLILLFQGSTWLTEDITAKKYPLYKLYQSKVSRFVPMWSQNIEWPSALKKKN